MTNYEEEMIKIDEIFGDTNFTVAIPYDELDDLLTDKTQIVIKNDYTCYCYKNAPRLTDYYTICGSSLTVKYILLELKKQGLNLDCNHQFIEGFWQTPSSDIQFELVLGS